MQTLLSLTTLEFLFLIVATVVIGNLISVPIVIFEVATLIWLWDVPWRRDRANHSREEER